MVPRCFILRDNGSVDMSAITGLFIARVEMRASQRYIMEPDYAWLFTTFCNKNWATIILYSSYIIITVAKITFLSEISVFFLGNRTYTRVHFLWKASRADISWSASKCPVHYQVIRALSKTTLCACCGDYYDTRALGVSLSPLICTRTASDDHYFHSYTIL